MAQKPVSDIDARSALIARIREEWEDCNLPGLIMDEPLTDLTQRLLEIKAHDIARELIESLSDRPLRSYILRVFVDGLLHATEHAEARKTARKLAADLREEFDLWINIADATQDPRDITELRHSGARALAALGDTAQTPLVKLIAFETLLAIWQVTGDQQDFQTVQTLQRALTGLLAARAQITMANIFPKAEEFLKAITLAKRLSSEEDKAHCLHSITRDIILGVNSYQHSPEKKPHERRGPAWITRSEFQKILTSIDQKLAMNIINGCHAIGVHI